MTVDQAKLNQVFIQVLEQTAFMFGDPAEKDELEPETDRFVKTVMTFNGPIQGQLCLIVPENMLPELAANVLGTDPDDEQAESHARDSLKELLNVVCGQSLTSLVDTKVIFDLGIPVDETVDESEWQRAIDSSSTQGFVVDDYPMLLEMSVKEVEG